MSLVTSRPSATDYQWQSTNGVGAATLTDTIRIAPNSANACNPTTQASRSCTYYIAVHGWESRVVNHYALVAHIGDANILLSNGNSFERTLRVGQVEYYVFLNAHLRGTVVFSVTPFQGNVGLFVDVVRTKPNSTATSTWRSDTAGGNLVALSGATAAFATYYIGVVALRASPARYTILATSYDQQSLNLNPVALINGRSVPDYLSSGTIRHFYYTFTRNNTKLTFHAQRRLGDPDLYLNLPHRTVYPNLTSYDMQAAADGSDFLIVRPAPPGTYRLSVHAWSRHAVPADGAGGRLHSDPPTTG